MTEEIYVYRADLPARIKGFTRANPDGSYTVIVNDNYDRKVQCAAYRHELSHIVNRDLESECSVSDLECGMADHEI